MKVFLLLFIGLFLLSGCATYKFQQGKPPYNKGYVAVRYNMVIPEYTVGKDNSVPELKLAQERFKRRKAVVEDYYKRMNYIENSFKENVWDRAVTFVMFIGGVFKIPFTMVSDYKYENDPAYRQRAIKAEEERRAKEDERIRKLKEELAVYIKQDLKKEEGPAFKK